MFELEITNEEAENKGFTSERLNLLRRIIESLSDIVDQMEIKASDKGLSIQVMDAMHVALADIFLSKDIFSSYRCDRDVLLGIPIKQFSTILKSIVVDDSSIIKMSCEDTPQTLKIQHLMVNTKYDFEVTLLQMGSENYSVPHINFDCLVKLPADQFRNNTKIIGSFGDQLILRCEKDEFILRQNSDLTKNQMSLRSNGESVVIESTDSVELEIGMRYINLINKISSLGTLLAIKMGNGAPVFFDIRLYDTLGYVRLYVAPKVDG